MIVGRATRNTDTMRVTMAEQLNPALVELTRASTRAMLEEVAAAMRGELGAAIREDRQTWFNAFQEEADAFARAMGALAAVLGVGLLGVIIAWRRASTPGAGRPAAPHPPHARPTPS